MDQQQVDYLKKREAQELEAMITAANEGAIQIHRELAQRYAELAKRVGENPGD